MTGSWAWGCVLWWIAGCGGDASDKGPADDDSATQHSDDTGEPLPVDADGDGHASVETGGDDCDDADANAYPGAPETCNDLRDLDCDGQEGMFDDACEEESDPPSALGYFVVGERAEDWTCLLYYDVYGSYVRDAPVCEDCAFTLEFSADYFPGAVTDDYPECAWADLEHWEEIDAFTTRWGFTRPETPEEPWVIWYYAATYGDFYPFVELDPAFGGQAIPYFGWTFFAEEDAGGQLETGVWFACMYDASI